jgi:hypothetical protein
MGIMSPARRAIGKEVRRTQEDIPDGGFPRFAICKPAFVRLEARKPYCHLWHYTGEYSAKTLVQRKQCLAAHDHGTSRDKAARFGLNAKIGRVESRTTVETHTPGARPDLESCMRTLIVSNGWQNSCSAMRIRKDLDWVQMTHRFHCSRYAPSRDMGAKTDTLSISRRPRHDGKVGKMALESICAIIFWLGDAREMGLWVSPGVSATS